MIYVDHIYVDHNATTPMPREVIESMRPWFGVPSNPSSIHGPGRAAARAMDEARARVAALCSWHAEGVYFTSGATEANATVLSRGRWRVGATEHPSVLVWGAETLAVDASGRVCGALDGDVSIMLANNETGVINRVRARHVDASQAPGRIAVEVDADFVTLSAHKFGGPQGVGALLVRRGVSFEPLLRGGPQERGRRAGTPNVAGIVGMGVAAARAHGMTPHLRDQLEAGLVRLGGRVAGADAERLPNTTCVGFEGVDAADLVVALDLAGIAASSGSACASGSPEPSHVLKAMGFPGSAVRCSLGEGNTEAEVEEILRVVARVLERMR